MPYGIDYIPYPFWRSNTLLSFCLSYQNCHCTNSLTAFTLLSIVYITICCGPCGSINRKLTFVLYFSQIKAKAHSMGFKVTDIFVTCLISCTTTFSHMLTQSCLFSFLDSLYFPSFPQLCSPQHRAQQLTLSALKAKCHLLKILPYSLPFKMSSPASQQHSTFS